MRTRRMFRPGLIPAFLFASAPLVCLLAIVAFQLTSALPEARRARTETAASFATLRTAGAVDRAVQDAERGQRGYLITGRDEYLAPYTAAVAKLPALMDRLQRLTQDSPDEQASVLRLQADLTTKLNELRTSIDAERRAGYDAAKAIVNTDVGNASMFAIQEGLASVEQTATARLASRQAREEAAERVVTKTFLLASVVSVLALIVGAVLLGRAQRRAEASENTLQATLDSVRESVVAFDRWDRLRAWNAGFARLMGVQDDTLQPGRPWKLILHASAEASDILERIGELDAASRRSGRPALVAHTTLRGRVLELFHLRTEAGTVTTLLDVTEQRHAEAVMRQAQKLEAVGQMTGGVAHDFNNLLTIIIGCLGFLRRSVAAEKRALERLDMIQIAADRGAKLTQQLLAFARRQPLAAQVVDLDQLTRELLPLLRRAVGDGVEVEFSSAARLWATTLDPTQFQAAVLNLAINSRDAMPDGGKLTIEVGNAALDDSYAANHAEVTPGQYVLFAMTDSGCGMDAATLSRALDPFFTTKPVGQGTGLGLPQVYGFVKQSGGHFKLYSEVGEGTTAKLYLPRSRESVPAPARPAAPAQAGFETILLVDDDDLVRASVADMLEELGYRVIAVQGGAQALEVLGQGRPIDLLFTDVVMPGIGGRRLADRARALMPSLRILFTSGYTENAIVHNGRLDPGVELLSKPYDLERLAAKIRRVLDAPAPTVAEEPQAP